MRWDLEVDMLVAGAGAGGMAAALVGAIEGCSVLVCEASDKVGGTASTSAGSLWIPANRQSLKAGYTDSAEDARRYLQELLGINNLDAATQKYLEYGPDIIDYFEKHSDVQFLPCGTHPDYLDMEGAAVSGRAIIPRPFDGRLLKKEFEHVRPPIDEFMLFGGMMVSKDDIARLLRRYQSVEGFVHGAKLVTRYALDRLKYSRGTRLVMGNALVARLYYSLLSRKVAVEFQCNIDELITTNGTVTGAVILQNGQSRRVRARKGVVLATGGFAHALEYRRAFLPQNAGNLSLACPTNVGKGIRLALSVGGHVKPNEHRTGAFWTPVSVTQRSDGTKGLFPHLFLDRAKPGVILVNKAGRRFVNEGSSYHHVVEAMLNGGESTDAVPSYLICTAEFVRQYGLGTIPPGAKNLGKYRQSGYIEVAPTLEDLARQLHMNPTVLRATVERNNEFARTGIDSDFNKGATTLSRFNGDPNHAPNPCLGSIDHGPFVSLEIWPAEIACSTGIVADENGQVLREGGAPIPGLYACGNDMASIMRGTYPGPGTTLGPALVFGWFAAMHASRS